MKNRQIDYISATPQATPTSHSGATMQINPTKMSAATEQAKGLSF